MAETTQLNKFRQKRLRSSANKTHSKDDKPVSSYFYPKHNLYTRQEFELLDSIYSDEPVTADTKIIQGAALEENFWPQNKEEYFIVSNKKNDLLTKLSWFLVGVMLTSVVWLIYFQVNVHEIRTKNDTQIVFQKSPQILTDKTVDKEITNKLEKKNQEVSKKEAAKSWTSWFKFKPKKAAAVSTIATAQVKYHTVLNGDSLWIIANKYYSDPSPDNITKLVKANNLKLTSVLQAGQKLVVPQ